MYLAYKGSACDEGTCSTIHTFKNWYDVTLKIVFGCTGKFFVYRVFCLQIVSLVCFYEITFSVILMSQKLKFYKK